MWGIHFGSSERSRSEYLGTLYLRVVQSARVVAKLKVKDDRDGGRSGNKEARQEGQLSVAAGKIHLAAGSAQQFTGEGNWQG